MQAAVRVCLVANPSTEEAFRDLGTFSFVALHFFSAGGQHSSTIAEILHIIERLDDFIPSPSHGIFI